MTSRLTLLCHAATSATRSLAFPGDEPLDALGRRRVARVTHRFNSADRCLASPALRATQTAEALGLAATIAPELGECDHGRWAGRSLDEVQAKEPEAVAEWLRDPTSAAHGGESVVALIARVSDWLDQRIDIPGATIAVTHASVIRAAIVAAIQAGPSSFRHIDIAPLTLVRLSGHGKRWTLVAIGPAADGL